MAAPPAEAASRRARPPALPRNLEHDLDDTIPREGGPDSQRLFREITARSLALLDVRHGERVVDLACGMGQDTRTLAAPARGLVIGLEPSNRMIRWGQAEARREPPRGRVAWLRAIAEALPLRGGAVDAVLCKGAMDHFLSPAWAMAEAARVLRPGGRIVVALANYDSLSCRLGRWRDRARTWFGAPAPSRRPYYEPPPDHLVRFGFGDILALVTPPLRLNAVEGLSLLWLFPPWSRLVAVLPVWLAAPLLATAFALGRLAPRWADVILIRADRPA